MKRVYVVEAKWFDCCTTTYSMAAYTSKAAAEQQVEQLNAESDADTYYAVREVELR